MDYKLRLIGQSKQSELIQINTIIAQGHHHFDALIEAREVNTTVSCIMNEMTQIKKLKNKQYSIANSVNVKR